MKYRIIEKADGNGLKSYQIEYKRFLFWNILGQKISRLGGLEWEPYEFSTFDGAEHFLYKEIDLREFEKGAKKITRKIVKTYENN